MKCDDCLNLLETYLDGEATEREAELDPEDFQNRAKVVYRMFLFDEIP